MDEDIGDNAGAYLRDVVDEIIDLEDQVDGLKADRKGLMDKMKLSDLPAGELVALLKRDDDKAAKGAKRMLEAGAILGKDVYADLVPAHENETNHGFSADDLEEGRSSAERIIRIDEDIKATNADIKAIYKRVKADGYSVPVLKLCVKFKRDPDTRDDFSSTNALIEAYLTAIEG